MKKVTYFLPGFSPDIEERFLERLIIYIRTYTYIHAWEVGLEVVWGGGSEILVGIYKDNSCWFSNSIVFAMINCEKMALFAVFFIAMVYENYKFFDTYVCGLYNVIR